MQIYLRVQRVNKNATPVKMDKCYTPSCISSNECVFHPRKAYFKADEDSHQPLKDTSAFLNDILELKCNEGYW